MKPNFLLLIMNAPNPYFYSRDKIRERAKDLGYTMFAFNGFVHSVYNDEILFKLSDIIDLI